MLCLLREVATASQRRVLTVEVAFRAGFQSLQATPHSRARSTGLQLVSRRKGAQRCNGTISPCDSGFYPNTPPAADVELCAKGLEATGRCSAALHPTCARRLHLECLAMPCAAARCQMDVPQDMRCPAIICATTKWTHADQWIRAAFAARGIEAPPRLPARSNRAPRRGRLCHPVMRLGRRRPAARPLPQPRALWTTVSAAKPRDHGGMKRVKCCVAPCRCRFLVSGAA